MKGTSDFLQQGRTPRQWAEFLDGRGIPISERTIRDRARREGIGHKIGRVRVLTADDMRAMFVKEGSDA